MDLIQKINGKYIVIPELPLEPPLKPSDWYEQSEDEDCDDGIDLDNGYVFYFGEKGEPTHERANKRVVE